jgi:hypothetical protein
LAEVLFDLAAPPCLIFLDHGCRKRGRRAVVEIAPSRSTNSRSVTEGPAMNALEAIVIGLLTRRMQDMDWATMPGAGWRAIARLIIAVVVIGLGVAALDMGVRSGGGGSGWVAAGPEAGSRERQ